MSNCPFCERPFTDESELDTHTQYCDLNPEIMRTVPDMLGLTFAMNGHYIRIIEVIPGIQEPLLCMCIKEDTDSKGNTDGSHYFFMQFSYAAAKSCIFGVHDSEYNRIAKKMIEDLKRSMI